MYFINRFTYIAKRVIMSLIVHEVYEKLTALYLKKKGKIFSILVIKFTMIFFAKPQHGIHCVKIGTIKYFHKISGGTKNYYILNTSRNVYTINLLYLIMSN